ncbi:hypothetical protein [Microbulbifer sp. VAAF005]|uniref:hypothetical protein n=1 Tax=Microbulbifer sp. VAAF005 TaxID=3034230 RepID=UPI0024ADF12A|nr:hypothetical protein [Microbulbifer sp. VAAF005]WHI45975.1 hypothetical protein P0078_19985 [Microbulbifer sp. VAAF005]
MGPLNYLDIDRLSLVPEKYWSLHEFCFYLHDSLMEAASTYELSGSHLVIEDIVQEIITEHHPNIEEFDLIELLKDNELDEAYRQHIVGHTVLALLSDMHQFLYSSLEAFERRKFSVGFSLLRKVLKEHLVFLCWIVADETDFINRFEGDVYKTLNNLSKEKRIEIFDTSIEWIELTNMFDSNVLWSYIFDKNFSGGFEPVWQMATHLVTSQGIIKTKRYSLNFAFEDRSDDYYFELLYEKLPYLLIFLVQVAMKSLSKTCEVDKKVVGRFIISTVGVYEALCLTGKSHIAVLLRTFFKDFLHCMFCGEKIRLTKKKRPRLFVSQLIECQHCRVDNQFPLDWLMSKANLVVKENGDIDTLITSKPRIA